MVVSALAAFIVLLFALVAAREGRRRIYGVERWGSRLGWRRSCRRQELLCAHESMVRGPEAEAG